MKRIIILALVTAFAVTGAMAQRTLPTVRLPKRIPAAASEKKFILTKEGVNVIVMGQKLQSQPPAGSVYDKAVKNYTNDFGIVFYNLMKGNQTVGRVAVSDGKIDGFYLSSPDVQTDNGIHPGMPLVDALKKEGVTSTMYYDDMEGEFTIDVSYGDITLMTLGSTDLSTEGVAKLETLEKQTQAWEQAGDGSDQPFIKLTPEDFNDIIAIMEIGCGISY